MRTTCIKKFAVQLYDKMMEIRAEQSLLSNIRVCLIESPKAGGDITVVFEHPEWDGKKAIVYRADGTWSGLSYWSNDQI